MSNIYTSYIRIRRRDKEHLAEDEIENLFAQIVNVHGVFGSYWVRIVKKYRKELKCLDIQFGGGKRTENILDSIEYFEKYEVVERQNIEGEKDEIFEYEIDSAQTFVRATAPRLCKYQFDSIIIKSDHHWLANEGIEIDNVSNQILKIEGIYYCSNDKGFVDLYKGSPYYSPQLAYTEDYPYDYFVLTETENLEFVTPPFLVELQQSQFERMPNDSKMIFLYQYRKVLTISKLYDKIEIQSADYWDNCADEKYLKNS